MRHVNDEVGEKWVARWRLAAGGLAPDVHVVRSITGTGPVTAYLTRPLLHQVLGYSLLLKRA
jgi:hypothetical protein